MKTSKESTIFKLTPAEVPARSSVARSGIYRNTILSFDESKDIACLVDLGDVKINSAYSGFSRLLKADYPHIKARRIGGNLYLINHSQ